MAPSRQADNRNVFLWFQDLATPFIWSVSRPAEVQPWEVRFAHPCRARARHPIHKAMGGHASHGHTSDRAFISFQFREGTIKTLWPRTPISRLLFNSIMVQLEHPAMHKMLEIIFVSIPLWFNWDMRTCRRPSANACFNSIMVQLEQDLKLILRKKLS